MSSRAQTSDGSPWDSERDPQRLRAARGRQSQKSCADEITADGGGVSQQQVSAWETGDDAPSSENLPAVRRYIERHANADPPSATRPGPSKVVPIRPGRDVRALPNDLREAVALRIASGVPMNKWDIQALEIAERTGRD